MSTSYKPLAPSIPNATERLEWIKALVAAKVAQPSTLKLQGEQS
jgi:hypothetical protein